MYASAGVGVLALLLGMLFTRIIPFLKKFCIPVPVSGGLLISLLTLLLYVVFGIECRFDGTIKDICMMLFFTSVGFQCDVKVIRTGGKPLLVMVLLVAVLIICQNLISVGISSGLGLSPLFGMAAGSIPMCGGHGTSGGFAPLLEQMEITCLAGNISRKDGEPYLHLHVTASRRDYTCIGGHLLTATVNGACELFVEDYGLEGIDRKFDPETGLNLYEFK